jgi:hypothetical protein
MRIVSDQIKVPGFGKHLRQHEQGVVFTHTILWLVIFFASGGIWFGVVRFSISLLHSPKRGIPYHDHFADGDNSEWSAYGGNWRVRSGAMVNESNERGAKLVTGQPYWHNYSAEADIALRSTGDAGIIARVSGAEEGVDAYKGIYAGLRMRDQSLILGFADHSWGETTMTMPYPIVPDAWYHIRMELRECHVEVSVRQDGKPNEIRLEDQFKTCPERGKIGLRSYDSGGLWKNVRVTSIEGSR